MSNFTRLFEEATAGLKLASLVGYAIFWVSLVIARWP
jgi:hypothetical protein